MTQRIFRQRKIESILSEDGTVKFDFMTSLEKIVVAKIVSNLWMRQNTQREIMNLYHSGISPEQSQFREKWQEIEDNILIKVSELCLPRSIEQTLKYTVPVLGNFILEWIQYHDKHILNTERNSIYSAADLINHITWTVRGRIDLVMTAKKILANQESSLSHDHKYKIACTFCLVDEIAVLAPKIVNPHYLDSVDIAIRPIVIFWTVYIKGDHKLHNRYFGYVSIQERTIQSLINYSHEHINNRIHKKEMFNSVPIMYVWKKLSEEEKARHLALLIKLGNEDLRNSLLSNLDYEQQQDIFKKYSSPILVGILNDWLWKEYFLPITLHILDIMNPQSYLYILKGIIEEMNKNCHVENNDMYNHLKKFFKMIWKNGPSHLKGFIFEHCYGHALDRLVADSLSWERDLDILDLIFKDLNAEQKKRIIFNKCGIKRCLQFFINDEWDLLELFLKYSLSEEEDISRIKRILINHEGVNKAYDYLEDEALDKIERLMMWAFKSVTEMDHFRQGLAHIVVWPATADSIIAKNKVDFTKLEDHFKWCAKGDLELTKQFKTRILKWHLGEKLIKELMENYQYELVDQILNWCYLDNEEQTAQFKCNFYKTNPHFVKMLIVKDTSLKMLDKFIGWSFNNEHQIQEFKTWLLSVEEKTKNMYSVEKSWNVCTHFLQQDQFEFADKIIKWCVTSDEDISKFKKELMFSNDVRVMFGSHYYSGKPDLLLLFRWFDPSEELVEAFKKTFPKEECPRNFHKLLDDFLQKRNNS